MILVLACPSIKATSPDLAIENKGLAKLEVGKNIP